MGRFARLAVVAAALALRAGGAHADGPRVIRVPEDAPTVRQAIEAAGAGDVVEIARGTRSESLRISKAITLRAAAGGVEIVATGDERAIEVEGADDVRLEGLVVRGGRSGIVFRNCRRASVAGTTIVGPARFGIALVSSEAVLDRDHVDCSDAGGGDVRPNGISLRDASTATMRGCTVDGAPAVGCAVGRASDATVEDCVVTGARHAVAGGGIGILVTDGAHLRLTGSSVERCDAGGVVLVASDAELHSNHLREDGAYGLFVSERSEATAEGDEVVGTRQGPAAGLPCGFLVSGRSRLSLRTVAVEGGEGLGVMALDGSRLSMEGCRVLSCADAGVDLEDRSRGRLVRCTVRGCRRQGVNVFHAAVLELDDSTVEGTALSDGKARGMEVQGGSRAWIRRAVVRGSGELGIGVFSASFASIEDSTVEGNGPRGVCVARDAHAVLHRDALRGHTEAGLVVLSGGEVAAFDNRVEDNARWGIYVDGDARASAGGNRFAKNGVAVFGIISARAALATTPGLTARLDARLPLGLRVEATSASSGKTTVLETANAFVPLAAGPYALAVRIDGAGLAIPWGRVELGSEEVVVPVQSGIALHAGGGVRVQRWRVRDAVNGAVVQDLRDPWTATPLPPGHYRVTVDAGGDAARELPVGPPEGVEVKPGEVTRVAVDGLVGCCRSPVSIELLASPTAAPGTARVRIGIADASKPGPAARLRLLLPDGRLLSVLGDAQPDALHPVAEVVGDHEVSLPADAAGGRCVLFAEAVDAASGTTLAADTRVVLLARKPTLVLEAPAYTAPGAHLRLTALATGAASGDFVVRVEAAGSTWALLPGGVERSVLVAGASQTPLMRRRGLPEGRTVLYDGVLPAALAGQGAIVFHATLRSPKDGAVVAEAEARTTSVAGTVTWTGEVRAEGAAIGATTSAVVRLAPAEGRGPSRVARTGPDGRVVLANLSPGLYWVHTTALDADGAFRESTWRLADLARDAVTADTETLGPPRPLLPAVPETAEKEGPEAKAYRPDDGAPVAPPAAPAPAGPPASEAGGCADGAPAGKDCACGRLPVCVFSGSVQGLEGILSGASTSTWPRRTAGDLGWMAGLERAAADALQARVPCLDIITPDLTLIEILGDGIKSTQRLKSALDAAKKAGDTAAASQAEAAIAAEVQKVILRAEQNMMVGLLCMAQVTLGGSKVWAGLRGWTLTAHATGPGGEPDQQVSAPSNGSHLDPIGALADQVAPGLAALQARLFCSCGDLTIESSTTQFPENPFAPGAHADTKDVYTLTCCGTRVQSWVVDLAEPGFRGVAGSSHRKVHRCCGEWARSRDDAGNAEDGDEGDSEKEPPFFCPGTWTLAARDFDCDGIPNLEDPTPFGDEAAKDAPEEGAVPAKPR